MVLTCPTCATIFLVVVCLYLYFLIALCFSWFNKSIDLTSWEDVTLTILWPVKITKFLSREASKFLWKVVVLFLLSIGYVIDDDTDNRR